MKNPWFRMYGDAIDNDKLRLLAFEDRWHFMALCCCMTQGIQDGSSDVLVRRRVAVKLGLQISELENLEQRLREVDLIGDGLVPLKWDERQFQSDSSTERMRKHREKKNGGKSNACDDVTDVTKVKRHSDVLDTDTDTDTDKDKNQNLLSSTDDVVVDELSKSSQPCPVEKLIDVYHTAFPDGSRVKVITAARRAAAKARWLEASRLNVQPFRYANEAEGLAAWRKFFEVCAESDFLTGKVAPQAGRQTWVADFDFFMQPSSFAKCLENKYHREIAA